MHIGILVGRFPSVTQTFVLDQITGLIDRGHTITIFAERRGSVDNLHSDVEEYNLLERTVYIGPPESKLKRLYYSPFLIWKSLQQDTIGTINSLDLLRFGKDSLSFRLLYYFYYIKPVNPDILLCHFGPKGNYGVSLKKCGVCESVAVMFHGLDIRRGLNEGSQIYKPVFEDADLVLTNSEKSKGNIQSMITSHDERDIFVHPPGVDTNQFVPGDIYPPKIAHKLNIISVGRLVPEKGYEQALKSIQRLQNITDRNYLKYTIIGDGDKRSELESLTAELGINSIVNFRGKCSREEVIRELQSSHVFLLTSKSEGFGLSILEAQSCGVPIVATRVGGIPEAMEDGHTGYLVEKDDIKSTAEKLANILLDDNMWTLFHKQSRKYVVENYDIDILNDRLEMMLEKII